MRFGMSAVLQALIVCLGLPLNQAHASSEIPETQHRMVLIGDAAIQPRHVTLPKDSAVLFVVNRSVNSLPNVRFDFGKHPTHCASQGLVRESDGTVRTNSPLGFRDFVSVCFPEAGEYTLHIDGLLGEKGPVPIAVTVK